MTEDIIRRLKISIESSENTEHECRYYLQYIKDKLVKNRAIEYRYVETERIGVTGRSDYIISACIDEGGHQSIRAYLWELKAPQCYIFEEDTQNRLKPSKELADAENKLLHYYLENKDSGMFHRQYGITSSDDIRLGGIIIGCKVKRVNGKYDEATKTRLYGVAKSTKDYIYRYADIILLTWDDILAYIQSSEIRKEEKISEELLKIEPEWLKLYEGEYDREVFEEKEHEINTLEDEFSIRASEIPIKVKCSCGHEISDFIIYGGVVSTDMREMGIEKQHVWNNDIMCEICGEIYFIEIEVWEYPEYCINLAQMPNCTCEVLNKNDISKIIGINVE